MSAVPNLHPTPATKLMASLLASAGYGYEDIVVKTGVSPLYAKLLVGVRGGKK